MIIGDRSKLPETTQQAVAKIEAATAHNRGRTLVVALAYGGRGEIAAAVRESLHELKGAELEERCASHAVSRIPQKCSLSKSA